MNVQHRTSNVEPRLGVVAALRNLISFVFKNPMSNPNRTSGVGHRAGFSATATDFGEFNRVVGCPTHSTFDVGRSMFDVPFFTPSWANQVKA
jgi:hypothetical protein